MKHEQGYDAIDRELDAAAKRSNTRLLMRDAALGIVAAFVDGSSKTLRIMAKIFGILLPILILALILEIVIK